MAASSIWLHRVSCLVLAIALGWSNIAQVAYSGNLFFVDPNGNDRNLGTAEAPWATLQWAADQVTAGDRVTVRPGTYAGFYLTANGTAGEPVEFIAQPGVLINEENDTTPDGINLEGASYVVIDGFEVAGMERTGVRTVGLPMNFATNVTIRNVYAHDNGRWGILTGHVDHLLIENNRLTNSIIEHGIYVSNSGDNPIVRNNITSGNARAGIQLNADLSEGGPGVVDGIISNAIISGNLIFDNGELGGSAINLDGVQDSLIENNLLYGNQASGISLFMQDGAAGSNNNRVINNTIHTPADARWALNIQNASTGNFVRNNILINDDGFRGAIDISANSLSGFSSDYNVVTSSFTTNGGDSALSLAQWRTAIGQDLHSTAIDSDELDELFMNVDGGNYQLVAGSIAENGALVAEAPAADLVGRPRPYGASVDIGALERILPGDYNADGAANAADYTVWRNSPPAAVYFGAAADGNVDKLITQLDYEVWKSHYGMTLGIGSVNKLAIVPEPMPCALISLGLAIVAALRRRR